MDIATGIENWKWETLLSDGVVGTRSPLSQRSADDAVQALEKFAASFNSDPEFGVRFDALLRQWSDEPVNRNNFAGFYTPYFRNRESREGYDDKIVWQFHRSFVDALAVHDLIDGKVAYQLHNLISRGVHFLKPFVEQIAATHPDLKELLMPNRFELPVVLRIMRYRPSPLAGTNPHVDKTALSSIIWTSDGAEAQKLVFAPKGAERLSQFFHPAVLTQSSAPAYVFFGAAVSQIHPDGFIKEAVHAVLPVMNVDYRYSIACFWLLPNHSMKDFSTARQFIDDIGIIRNYDR